MMATSVLFALLGLASANPVDGGIQLAVFPEGVDYTLGWVEGEEFEVERDELSSDYSCYDALGVRDFNATIPVDDVAVDLLSNLISVRVDFGTIHGEDMEIFAEDSDWWDICVEFTTDFDSFSIENGVFTATFYPRVEQGKIALSLEGEAEISGDLDTDINNVPDSLILGLIEGLIWDKVSETVTDMLPELVASMWSADLLSGTLYDFDLSLVLNDADVHQDALEIGATLETSWLGSAACEGETTSSGSRGRQPEIDFGNGGGSALSLGLTERQLNSLFDNLWGDGFLCFDEDRMEALFSLVSALFDPDVVDMAATASFDEVPEFRITNSGASVGFEGFDLNLTGELGGEEVVLLRTRLSLQAELDLGVEASLGAITLNVHSMELDIEEFEAEHLLSGGSEASAHLQDFLEGWLVGYLEDQIQGMALFATQFHVMKTYIRLDEVDYQAGGMGIFLSLYHEDDPAVDKVAPDTEAWLETTDPVAQSATLAWKGSDDRDEPLVYATRVNGAGWSDWTTDTRVVLEDLAPGMHNLEVRARDSWFNEDPDPYLLDFAMAAAPVSEETSGCGCATSAPARSWAIWVGGVLGLLLRRRSS